MIMKNLKRTLSYSLYVLLACVFCSCESTEIYPRYSVDTKDVIADSLKNEYRTWITETVRAASQNMTGGDYEDVDETIEQCERIAERIFSEEVTALRIEVDEHYYNDFLKTESELNDYEKTILDSLTTNAR